MGLVKLSAVELAYYILARIGRANQLKIQKLVYYIDAWHLAYFDEAIVFEDYEAWVHGPVVRQIWDRFGSKSRLYTDLVLKNEAVEGVLSNVENKITQDQKDLIDNVLQEYGDKSAYHLESLTHSETPWKEARSGCMPGERSDTLISKESMKKYYRSLIG
jgi:uncharacterized phage-associated protein